MAMQENAVLPGAADAAGGMSPQVQAFLNLLMGGGLTPFGAFGGQQFGGFGQFLMNNPSLMAGLGLTPQGAVPGPLPGSAPVVDSGPVAPPQVSAAGGLGTSAPITGGNLGGSQVDVLPPLAPTAVSGAPGSTPLLGGGADVASQVARPITGASGLDPLAPMLRRG